MLFGSRRGSFFLAPRLTRFALLRAHRFAFAFQISFPAFSFRTDPVLLTHAFAYKHDALLAQVMLAHDQNQDCILARAQSKEFIGVPAAR
jgi:hypothetical protein